MTVASGQRILMAASDAAERARLWWQRQLSQRDAGRRGECPHERHVSTQHHAPRAMRRPLVDRVTAAHIRPGIRESAWLPPTGLTPFSWTNPRQRVMPPPRTVRSTLRGRSQLHRKGGDVRLTHLFPPTTRLAGGASSRERE